jgi:hypothetical protein
MGVTSDMQEGSDAVKSVHTENNCGSALTSGHTLHSHRIQVKAYVSTRESVGVCECVSVGVWV